MADQYEPVLSEEAIAVIWACHIVRDRNISASGDAQIRIGQSIERATIEAFRAKHLPELNLQRCYDVQRDELMAARERIARLESALYLALPFIEDHEDNDMYKPGVVKKVIGTIRAALTTTAPQAADETTTAAPAASKL